MPTVAKREDSTDAGLFFHVVGELVKEFAQKELSEVDLVAAKKAVEELPFYQFAEQTSRLKLEPWQLHLCEILQSLVHTRGRRILFHKPPQHGGSVLVSQRFPAYSLGNRPDMRVCIACHNIEKATEFSAINKTIMTSEVYGSMFPENKDKLYISPRAPDKMFSTRARKQYRDAQASISALGLQTGFVGKGADLLIIDDPYASPQEAKSKAARKNIWTFWTEGAKVRVDSDGNIIIMFHRYHEDDFVGQLIKEEGLKSMGGVWELYSYRAQWDGDEDPKVGGPDPLNRKVGEYLSPRKEAQPDFYPEQKRNPGVWLSQYQGKPSREDGTMFKVGRMSVVAYVDTKFIKVARAWDVASTEEGGDWTVGTLMGLGEDGYVYVLDVFRDQLDTDARNTMIRRVANRDRVFYPDIVTVLPQDPGGAGKDISKMWVKLMIGHVIKIVPSFNRGSKEVKAVPWSAYVNSGYVRLVYKGDINARDDDGEHVSWVPEFIDEHKRFLAQDTDDQVDSASDAFGEVALEIDNPPGEDHDMLGLMSEESRVVDEDSQEAIVQEYLATLALSGNGYYGDEGIPNYASTVQGSARSSDSRRNIYDEPPSPKGQYSAAQRKSLRASKRRRVQYY